LCCGDGQVLLLEPLVGKEPVGGALYLPVAAQPIEQGGGILKIILFGSYAKGSWVNNPAQGYVSDYDVLVIVNNEKLVEDYRFWNRVEEWGSGGDHGAVQPDSA
jgi:hypothetical protein